MIWFDTKMMAALETRLWLSGEATPTPATDRRVSSLQQRAGPTKIKRIPTQTRTNSV
jgi:hypothetical protein